MAGKKKWIQAANIKEGALTKKAKAAGQSPMAYAAAHKSDPGKTGKQARLALTFKRMNAKRRKGKK